MLKPFDINDAKNELTEDEFDDLQKRIQKSLDGFENTQG